MSEPKTAKPDTEVGFSYELGIDIDLGTESEPKWQPVRFCKAIAPAASAKEIDGQTYDDFGADHPIKVGESWNVSLNVQQHRLANGQYLPEVESMMSAARPDAVGDKATRRFRVYDKPADGQAANPTDAFMGVGTVSVSRAQTGTAEEGGWNFEIKGQGPRIPITNPLVEAGKPVLTKVEPERAAVGKQVTISGAALSKASKVEFGTHTAEFTIVAGQIVATVPTGASGPSPIKVTNAAGASEPLAFNVS